MEYWRTEVFALNIFFDLKCMFLTLETKLSRKRQGQVNKGGWEALRLFPAPKSLALLTLSETTNSKVFADDNFKFGGNGRNFSKRVENTVGIGEIARYEQFLLFPRCFQKACSTDT